MLYVEEVGSFVRRGAMVLYVEGLGSFVRRGAR